MIPERQRSHAMKEAGLERLLTGVEALVRDIMAATDAPSTVWDAHGKRLLQAEGCPSGESDQKYAVRRDGQIAGWVSGGERAELLAALLSHLVTQESDKEALLDEILGLYREMNLLFNLSGRLAPALTPDAIGETVLREAGRLIKAPRGAVVLFGEGASGRTLATVGQGVPPPDLAGVGCRAEIVNNVRRDPRFPDGWGSATSLICAPLTSRNKSIGAAILASETPVTYTAADLKLLTSIAALAAPSLENALLHEKELQAERERADAERRQRQQFIDEINEAIRNVPERVDDITSSDAFRQVIATAAKWKAMERGPGSGGEEDEEDVPFVGRGDLAGPFRADPRGL